MTADYVAFHAAERPDALAVLDNGRAVTYAQFSRDIRQFMRALQAFELPRDAWVGVGCDDIYLEWVILLACERLAIPTASLHRASKAESKKLLDALAFVLSESEVAGTTGKRRQALTPEWIQEVRALPEVEEHTLPPKADGDLVRILRTTGTTGTPKLLCSSRRTLEVRSDSWTWRLGLDRGARYLITLALDVPATATLATAVIRVGGTAVIENRLHLERALLAHDITHLALFPIHLRRLLDGLPADYRKPRDLSLVTFGATLSDALRGEAMARLASFVEDTYGSHETGFISRIVSMGAGGVGSVSPVVDVQVVDETGLPLPYGRLGKLRIRAPFMQTEYFDDSELTARLFQDGWFQPGDLAILHGARRIQLIGRSDEMLNIGGAKVSPTLIEEIVIRCANASDAGVVSRPSADGIEELWIAVVGAPGGGDDLKGRIAQGLGALQFATLHIVRVSHIPRNAGGKIQRDLLREAVAAAPEVSRPA
jgi:acyl-coenzyme A synthetase/AMP-(fatty) acid ligase